jgi:hypothetical protein
LGDWNGLSLAGLQWSLQIWIGVSSWS